MDLSGMAISVIGYNEPGYLYVTLDALTRVSGVLRFPITVYVDGGISSELKKAHEEVVLAFPPVAVEFGVEHLGLRENIMRGIRRPVEEGAPLVLYIEGDHLLHPDALDALRTDDSGCFFVSLILREEPVLQEYNPKGNLIARENALRLLKWMDEKSYLGKTHPVRGYPLGPEYKGHDAAVNIFMKEHDEYTSFSSGVYLAHFGLFGSNCPRLRAAPELLEIDQRMFAGPRSQWLDNVARLLEAGDYPTGSPVLDSRLWPRGFRYYGPVARSYGMQEVVVHG